MAPKLPSSLALPFLPALFLIGCAATPPDPGLANAPACPQDARCFYERGIRSFRVLDNRTVVVLVGRDQCPFKLELDGIFCNVRMASVLAFNDADGRICRFDRTIVATNPFAREGEICRVSQVTPMTDDELLEAYATNGLAPPLPSRGSGEIEVVEEEPLPQAPQETVGGTGAGAPAATEPSI